jgi:hypothetical protein
MSARYPRSVFTEPDMTTADTFSRGKGLALAAFAAVLLFLLVRHVLQIDVWYVLSGGVPWILAVETGVVGFVLGWCFGTRRR